MPLAQLPLRSGQSREIPGEGDRPAVGRLHLRSRGLGAAGGEGECAHRRARIRAEDRERTVWVRVNGLETGLAANDLEAVVGVAGLAGFFLPKVETADEVRRWDAMIGGSRRRARRGGRLAPARHLDRERGVLNAYAMATAAARVVSLTRRRAGRRSQHRPRLRLVDRRAGNAACALACAACGARSALRHAARRRVRRCARRRGFRARHRALAPARLSRA